MYPVPFLEHTERYGQTTPNRDHIAENEMMDRLLGAYELLESTAS